jgi:hypothetical protein
MMKNIVIYRILIAISIVLLVYFIIKSLPQIFTDGTLSFEILNNVFGNIIVTTIFLIHTIIKNKDINLKNIYKALFRSLIIISVIFFGIMIYTLIENGFLTEKGLFWQISGIISGIISIIFLQHSQQQIFNVDK